MDKVKTITLQVNRSNLLKENSGLALTKVRIFHLKKEIYLQALEADVVVMVDSYYRVVIKDRTMKKLTRKPYKNYGL